MKQLKNEVEQIYREFFDKLTIEYDKENSECLSGSGLWKKGPAGKELRFATMPYIGRNYLSAKTRILFVGLDIGKDEYGCIQSFDERQGSIDDGGFNKNPHIAGTFVSSLYLLKDNYDLDEYWLQYKKSTLTCKMAMREINAPKHISILSHIALTNYYKFVSTGRELRSGEQDRIDIGILQEELFLKEVIALAPHVIVFQSKNFHNMALLNKLSDYKIIIAPHPSNRNKGGRIPVNYINSFGRM